jgi:hypothetical protein
MGSFSNTANKDHKESQREKQPPIMARTLREGSPPSPLLRIQTSSTPSNTNTTATPGHSLLYTSTNYFSTASSPISPPPSPLTSPRALYADSFDRPTSSRSLPSVHRYRKNVKEMTGFTTTEEEFEALPLAVRRKVRLSVSLGSFFLSLLFPLSLSCHGSGSP